MGDPETGVGRLGAPERLRRECSGRAGVRPPAPRPAAPAQAGCGAPATALRGDSGGPGRRPSLLPALTRGPRATTPRDSPLARYLSPGHPPTWPLHFRDTTLRAEPRGGTEGSLEADGGGRTSGLRCRSLSPGGAGSLVRPSSHDRTLPTSLSPASCVTSPEHGRQSALTPRPSGRAPRREAARER